MTSEEFFAEVKTSDICPENFDIIYRDFSHYQKLAMNTLNEFHRVCEKEGIHYQLTAGTLLGAIRDDGQIPWDYDIDVAVPYSEKDRLVAALDKELSDEYYYYCPESDKKCRHYFMRVTPKNYRSDLLHVDVFYLVGVPDDVDERKQFYWNFERVFNTRYSKLVKFREYPIAKWKKIIQIGIGKVKCSNVKIKDLDIEFNSICSKIPLKSSKTCMLTQTTVKNLYIQTDMLCETKLYTTTKGTFRVPVQYDAVLRAFYHDYIKIYPLKNRINELLNGYYKLTNKNQIIENDGRYYLK